MKRLLTAIASMAALALSAEAQAYRCENGGLVGGASDVSAKCTVNSSGQITSVTPYQNTSRQSVRIYPKSQTLSSSVKSYNTSKPRGYAPTPLTPQSNVPPASIIRPGYTPRHSAVQTAPSHRTTIYRPATTTLRSTTPHIISATPSAHIQSNTYAAPCNFKIREVKLRPDLNVYEVCYSDIRPTSDRSVKRLYSRIKKASQRACGTDYNSVLTRWNRTNRRCVDASLDRAVMSSGIDPLRAYHLAKTGKGIPVVRVGPMRDAL